MTDAPDPENIEAAGPFATASAGEDRPPRLWNRCRDRRGTPSGACVSPRFLPAFLRGWPGPLNPASVYASVLPFPFSGKPALLVRGATIASTQRSTGSVRLGAHGQRQPLAPRRGEQAGQRRADQPGHQRRRLRQVLRAARRSARGGDCPAEDCPAADCPAAGCPAAAGSRSAEASRSPGAEAEVAAAGEAACAGGDGYEPPPTRDRPGSRPPRRPPRWQGSCSRVFVSFVSSVTPSAVR